MLINKINTNNQFKEKYKHAKSIHLIEQCYFSAL